MADEKNGPETQSAGLGKLELHIAKDAKSYRSHLADFDAAICEALAVGQAQAGRMAPVHIGYGTKIFARMCSHGTALIMAAPLSRWAVQCAPHWEFAAVAPHARALMEGLLLLSALMEEPASDDEISARVNIMHLNDCTRRRDLFTDLGIGAEEFEPTLADLRSRLESNSYFKTLPPGLQKSCLNGKIMTISPRDELIAKAKIDKGFFDAMFDLCSQHTHILPISFYRIEANARGSGLYNEVDLGYISLALTVGATLLSSATDLITGYFTDTEIERKGIKSEFSPGPRANRPRKRMHVAPATSNSTPIDDSERAQQIWQFGTREKP